MSSSQCCDNPPTVDPAFGGGEVVDDFAGLKAYVTGSAASKNAIVLVADVFGYEAPNLRNLADKVASHGFYVVVPDFFYGDPLVVLPGQDTMTQLMAWAPRHPFDKTVEDAKAVIDALKEKGASAVGAGGFCWGAKPVVELAKLGYINAAVICHPSRVSVDDIKEVKCHICVLGAEFDQATPPAMAKQFEEILSTKSEMNSYVKIFPAVAHGWTMRYDVNDKPAVEKAEEAHKDMADWFVKYVN